MERRVFRPQVESLEDRLVLSGTEQVILTVDVVEEDTSALQRFGTELTLNADTNLNALVPDGQIIDCPWIGLTQNGSLAIDAYFSQYSSSGDAGSLAGPAIDVTDTTVMLTSAGQADDAGGNAGDDMGAAPIRDGDPELVELLHDLREKRPESVEALRTLFRLASARPDLLQEFFEKVGHNRDATRDAIIGTLGRDSALLFQLLGPYYKNVKGMQDLQAELKKNDALREQLRQLVTDPPAELDKVLDTLLDLQPFNEKIL